MKRKEYKAIVKKLERRETLLSMIFSSLVGVGLVILFFGMVIAYS